ncbi:MAG: hypothetical protein WC107_01240 [Patescibacteria group bacterium]
MKYLIGIFFALGMMFVATPKASAATSSAVDNFFQNKLEKYEGHILAYYTDGLHGIVGESGITHEGIDLVVEVSHGCKKVIKQWFWGTSDTEGLHGEKSVWREVGLDAKKCLKSEVLVKDAKENGWGDYLKPGMDYCVKTTNFSIKDKNQKDFKWKNKLNHWDWDRR